MTELFQQATQTPTQPAEQAPVQDKKQEALRVASELFRQGPDWVTFFREVLGIEGVTHRLFESPAAMLAFEQSTQYAEIQQMVAKLRERSNSGSNEKRALRSRVV